MGKRPIGRQRTRWIDSIEDLGWNKFGHRPSEIQSVSVNQKVWRLNLGLLLLQTTKAIEERSL